MNPILGRMAGRMMGTTHTPLADQGSPPLIRKADLQLTSSLTVTPPLLTITIATITEETAIQITTMIPTTTITIAIPAEVKMRMIYRNGGKE